MFISARTTPASDAPDRRLARRAKLEDTRGGHHFGTVDDSEVEKTLHHREVTSIVAVRHDAVAVDGVVGADDLATLLLTLTTHRAHGSGAATWVPWFERDDTGATPPHLSRPSRSLLDDYEAAGKQRMPNDDGDDVEAGPEEDEDVFEEDDASRDDADDGGTAVFIGTSHMARAGVVVKRQRDATSMSPLHAVRLALSSLHGPLKCLRESRVSTGLPGGASGGFATHGGEAQCIHRLSVAMNAPAQRRAKEVLVGVILDSIAEPSTTGIDSAARMRGAERVVQALHPFDVDAILNVAVNVPAFQSTFLRRLESAQWRRDGVLEDDVSAAVDALAHVAKPTIAMVYAVCDLLAAHDRQYHSKPAVYGSWATVTTTVTALLGKWRASGVYTLLCRAPSRRHVIMLPC
jgi:hypothetical protein